MKALQQKGLVKKGKEPNTERSSFCQNYSVANLNEKYRDILDESNRLQNPSLVSLNNNSQINLVNRYKKEALSRDPDAKGKCAPLGSSVQEMTPEQIEWEEILNKFRKWRPNPLQFEEMSVLFEDIVKLIMKKELELSELHKKLIISEEHHLKESLSMFNESTKCRGKAKTTRRCWSTQPNCTGY